MGSPHHISNADVIEFGKVLFPPARGRRRGIEIPALAWLDLGTPQAADADAFIVAATGSELPNAGTIVYEFPADNTSPTDAALRSGELDVPRNIVAAVTHSSSVVAMTIVLTGEDQYGERMVETLSITAGDTSKSATGAKAFARLHSIAITSAGNAQSNTLNIGTGAALGLPVRVDANNLIAARTAGAADTGTLTAADTTDPTATTGDVRGTFTPSGTLNGTNSVKALVALNPPASRVAIYGRKQYGG